MRIWLVILVMALPCVVFSQAGQQAPFGTEMRPVEITADSIDYCEPVLTAEGNVLFRQGDKFIYATRLVINTQTGIGQLKNVVITTCCRPKPDYSISAREITMTRDMHLRAQHVRVRLWGVSIATWPKLGFDLSGGPDERSHLPQPGFGKYDGLFVVGEYALISSSQVDLDAYVKPTTKAGIQGGVTGGVAINGDTQLAPPYVPDTDSELRRQSLLRPMVEDISLYTGTNNQPHFRQICAFPVEKPHPSLLAGFGALLRRRVYDIDEPGLVVTRLPEIGVRYVSPQVNIIDKYGYERTGLQSETRVSWGRFEESPTTEDGFIGRWDGRCLVSSTIAMLGPYTALRGAALARYSSYTTGDNYGVLGAQLDISRIFPSGSFGSLRLIGHAISGETPLEFDNVDIPYEVQGVGRYVRGRNTYGILLDYDLSEHSVRNWKFSFSHRFHCLEPSITWNNRFGQISLNLRVLGLQ